MPGPRPTPTVILAARGSWRAKERAGEPAPPSPANYDPPSDLTGDAREVWITMAPRLVASGLLTAADLPTFARYCRTYAIWQTAMTTAEETTNRENVLTLAKVDAMLRSLEASFGLTPSDRTGLRVEQPQADGKARFFETRAAS